MPITTSIKYSIRISGRYRGYIQRKTKKDMPVTEVWKFMLQNMLLQHCHHRERILRYAWCHFGAIVDILLYDILKKSSNLYSISFLNIYVFGYGSICIIGILSSPSFTRPEEHRHVFYSSFTLHVIRQILNIYFP